MKKLNRVRKSREFQKLIHTGRKKAGESFVFYYAPKAEEEARIKELSYADNKKSLEKLLTKATMDKRI